MRTKALEGDSSDNAAIVTKVSDWSLPDPDLKKQLWAEITDLSSKEPLKELNLKMQGFWQRRQQLDLITPYFENYYNVIEKIVEIRDREFAESFMNNLSPAFMARDVDEKNFSDILARTNPDTEFFILFLKKQIETMDITKRSRVLCETYKMD